MKLWDFSKRFSRVAEAWMKQNAGKYRIEEMEERLPDLYMRWLNTPASWLDGEAPATYFDRFDDAAALVRMVNEYCRANIAVPDPLFDRIVALGADAVGPLTAALLDAGAQEKSRELAGSMLVEIGEALPLAECVALIADAGAPESVREQAVAILRSAGRAAEPLLLSAMEGAEEAARCAYLDVLLDCSDDPRLFDWALYGLHNQPERRVVYASFLLRLGDARAIEPMQQMLRMTDLRYVDFMEIANAVESLGGEVTVHREFAGDADYEQLRTRPDDGEGEADASHSERE
ncbi:MAG: hypothetical protein Q4E13_07200 [Clostridia bacterium]|nr:hypothetical protein [Clostridia bacterium]